MTSTTRGLLAATLASTIWGGMYVVSRYALAVVPPLTLLALRFLVALPTLWVWHGLTERRRPDWRWPDREAWQDLLFIGFVGYAVSLGAQFAGTALAGAAVGSVITSATPAFVALFAWLILRERPDARKLIGLAIASAGVLLVIGATRPGGATGSTDRMLAGGAFLVLAAVSWALYSVLVRRATLRRGLSSLTITLGATVCGMLFDLPLAGMELAGSNVGTIMAGVHPVIVLAVLYLGVISTALAFHLWNVGFALLDANTAALCLFAQPLVGAALGALLLGETLTAGFVVGGLLIALGALISERR